MHPSYSPPPFPTPTSLVSATDSHAVQRRDPYGYVTTYASPTQSGTVNPLRRSTRSYQLTLDSRFRPSEYPLASDYAVTLPAVYANVVSMTLSAVELPTEHMYNVTAPHGHWFLADGVRCEVPPGKYTVSSLLAAVQDACPSVAFAWNEDTQRVCPVSTTGVQVSLTWWVPSAENVRFQQTLGYSLGARAPTSVATPTATATATGWLAAPARVALPPYLFLVVNEHAHNKSESVGTMFPHSLLRDNVLARVPTDPFALVQSTHVVREYFGPITILKLRVSLVDPYGDPVPLEGHDYSVALTLELRYDV